MNTRLKKELFDCSNIGDFYDCGCADDDKGEKKDQAKSPDGAADAESGKAARKPQLELERDGCVRVLTYRHQNRLTLRCSWTRGG